MKKDRQSFFNESNFQQSSYGTTPNFGMTNQMPMNAGYGQQSSQSFYAGPIPNTMGMNQTMSNDYMSDIESRLAKIERQINRLESRVSKLENQTLYSTNDYNSGNDTMYMV